MVIKPLTTIEWLRFGRVGPWTRTINAKSVVNHRAMPKR
jgi:hypothetical protein